MVPTPQYPLYSATVVQYGMHLVKLLLLLFCFNKRYVFNFIYSLYLALPRIIINKPKIKKAWSRSISTCKCIFQNTGLRNFKNRSLHPLISLSRQSIVLHVVFVNTVLYSCIIWEINLPFNINQNLVFFLQNIHLSISWNELFWK